MTMPAPIPGPSATSSTSSSHTVPHEDTHADLLRLGSRPYADVWHLQQTRVEARLNDTCPDALLLVEHEAVYTVGRRGQDAHWQGQQHAIEAAGIPLYRVDRGGSVTYHGPGQLVGYPIMKLRPPYPGPKGFVWRLEDILIRTLSDWSLAGFRRQGLHGVWTEQDGIPQKLAAVGIRLIRGVTMHGFALNVCLDLRPFEWIVPCGIDACRVTSMAALLGKPVSVEEVAAALATHFASGFELTWISPSHGIPLSSRLETPYVERT